MLAKGKLKFIYQELQPFNWIFSVAPCFPVSSTKIKVLKTPSEFYKKLVNMVSTADRRVSIASLYIGTGSYENELLQKAKLNVLEKKDLQFRVLLDYQRGTRGRVNSLSMLEGLVEECGKQCQVALYQTPKLRSSRLTRFLPDRYNELVGLQHMKLYVADNTVLISGANCSHDYFTTRQDRYVQIEDADLADYYWELIEHVSSFSKPLKKGSGVDLTQTEDSATFIAEAYNKINSFIGYWLHRQANIIVEKDVSLVDACVFPLVQMGELGVAQDSETTAALLAAAPPPARLYLSTGYFNLTPEYARTLLANCPAHVSLLMAHPNANGFLKASGVASGIPAAYSHIAKEFWQRVCRERQEARINLLEYERPGWTFHAKGLWYCPRSDALGAGDIARLGADSPWLTLVGSANLGARSVHKDLEAQAVIATISPHLQKVLRDECASLVRYSQECGAALQTRVTPLWVRAAVLLFRSYF